MLSPCRPHKVMQTQGRRGGHADEAPPSWTEPRRLAHRSGAHAVTSLLGEQTETRGRVLAETGREGDGGRGTDRGTGVSWLAEIRKQVLA